MSLFLSALITLLSIANPHGGGGMLSGMQHANSAPAPSTPTQSGGQLSG